MSAPEENYMQAMRDTSLLFGMNDVFVEGLYEDYLADPASVPEAWHGYFDILQVTPGAVHEVAHSPIQRAFAALPKADAASATHDADLECKQAHVSQLIDAYRRPRCQPRHAVGHAQHWGVFQSAWAEGEKLGGGINAVKPGNTRRF